MKRILSLSALCLVLVPSFAFAEEATNTGIGSYAAIAAAFAIGLAAFGGTFAQGKAVSSCLDSIGRNPGASGSLFTPMLLGLAFIESLVIIAFVVAYLLVGKI